MPSWCGVPATVAGQVLDHERHALERAVRRLGRERLLEQRVDDRVELAVERLDPLYGALRQLPGRHLPGADEVGLGGGVEMRLHGSASSNWPDSQDLSSESRPAFGTFHGDGTRLGAHRPQGPQGLARKPRGPGERPGHIIPILEREFDDFDNEAEQFLGGDLPEDQFIGFRLKQGVYGQRQADVQMIRVKLPFGGITPEQMEAFADVVEQYAPLNKGHITTRQNIQLHHIPLRDAAAAIRELSDSGLSEPRGLRQHRCAT